MFDSTRTSGLFSAFAALVLLHGCSAAPPMLETGPVFFPPAPNPPRIQYLTSINDSSDIEGKTKSFSLFLLGGQESDSVRPIFKPYGITSAAGKIYICDIGAGNVVIIDPAQKTYQHLKGNYSVGKLKKPANLTVDKEGRIYVADPGRREIVVYSPEGEFLKAFGKQMKMKPSDVAVDDQNLYVLDLAENEIKILDRVTGEYLRSIGKRTEESEGLSLATNMTLGPDGFIYVTNIGTGKVLKLDRDGHIIHSFGEFGDIVGQFARPKGIAVDDQGRMFIVDSGHQNVQVFNAEARILIFFGDPGLVKGSLNLPAGITVTRDNLEFFQKFADPSFVLESVVLVANQYGEAKVSVYGLGHRAGEEEDPAKVAGQSASANP